MLVAKGYADIGWNPVEGERYLDFLRFAVFCNGTFARLKHEKLLLTGFFFTLLLVMDGDKLNKMQSRKES